MKTFRNGDVVTLTPEMMAACDNPENYQRGVVVDDRGYWNVYDVEFNGYDFPIGMRADEIQLLTE